MDKKRAIEIISAALASINTTRQNHDIFVQALNVLAFEMKKPEDVKEEPNAKAEAK